MSLSKDWPAQLNEFYCNYNNRVNKSTKPSTPYQIFFKRPNFAAPVDDQIPYTILTEEKRMFLKSAHLDVQDEDNSEEQFSDVLDEEHPVEENEPSDKLTSANDRLQFDAGNVTFEEAMNILDEGSEVEGGKVKSSKKDNVHVQEVINSEVLVDPLGDASDYYKRLYNHRFGAEMDVTNENYNTSNKKTSEFGHLKEYFQRRQLELYPLEFFSDIQEPNLYIYSPPIGEQLEFRTNPAMNKGTAVFSSGFWRAGVCQDVREIPSRGKLFVVKDIITNSTYELNRHQLRPCKEQ